MKKISQYILLIPFTFNFFNFTVEQLSSMTKNLTISKPIYEHEIDTNNELLTLKISCYSNNLQVHTTYSLDNVIYLHCVKLFQIQYKKIFCMLPIIYNPSSIKFKRKKQSIMKLLNKSSISNKEMLTIMSKISFFIPSHQCSPQFIQLISSLDKIILKIIEFDEKNPDAQYPKFYKAKELFIKYLNQNLYFIQNHEILKINNNITVDNAEKFQTIDQTSYFETNYKNKKIKIIKIINYIIKDINNKKYSLSNDTVDNLQDFFQSIYIFLDIKINRKIIIKSDSIFPIIKNFFNVLDIQIEFTTRLTQYDLTSLKIFSDLTINIFPEKFLKNIKDIMIVLFTFFRINQ